ncbi:MAG TPA: ubiquitin-like domain-containing protein [Anaerolineales bacterium]|nr:ubiquitin-like domain-containing protein [Anaerolineales bacterium]
MSPLRLPASRKLLFASLALALLGLALFAFGFRKQVTLVVDGQNQALGTYALTVGGLLSLEKIALAPNDTLTPPAESWIKNGDTITLEHAVPVQILADGQVSNFYSTERLPLRLLAQAGIVLSAGDELFVSGRLADPAEILPRQPVIPLQVRRGVTITLHQGGKVLEFTSTAPSLGQALWQAGITLLAADRLDPPASTPLTTDLEAELQRARPITITTAISPTQTVSITTLTAAATVGEALAEAGLPIQGLDYSLPPAESPLPADGLVRLVRVREEVLVEQSPLAFETLTQPAPEVDLDTQTVVQTGEYGLTAQRVRIRYEDGVEVSRLVEGQWVARQPQARIIGYGTKVVERTISTPDGPICYWRALTMWATSYHPSTTGSTTASGLPLEKGVAAIDRRYIPFYTRMYIPGYGEAVAADVGGGVVGRMIDLGYSDDDYEAWHQYVTVYFLCPAPASIVWIIP